MVGKPIIYSVNIKQKSHYWFCHICGKNYTLINKKQHLKTKKHMRNELKRGGGILDEPIEDKNLQAPLIPTQYKPKSQEKPVPKPRTKRRPVPYPRNQLPKRLHEKVKKLIEEITPYYEPERMRQFKKLLKFIPEQKVEIKEKAKVLKNNAKSYEIKIINKFDPFLQLNDTKYALAKLLKSILKSKKGIKISETLRVELSKQTEDGRIYREPYFNSEPYTITNEDSVDESLDLANEKILATLAGWMSDGSNWAIEEVKSHYLNIVSYLPLGGSSHFKLPQELRNSRKGIINPINKDNKCLKWCHVRHLHPVKKDPQRIKEEDHKYAKELDYSGVTFPVTVKDMGKIEKQNSINISVFGYEKYVYPIRVSEQKFKNHLKVLRIEDKDGNEHYVLITDFDRLMTSFTKHKDKKHFCMHCLKCCSSERTLEMHQKDCITINGTQAIKMPPEGSKIYFRNRQKMLPVPFVIYADFEAITEKIDSCRPSDKKSYTETYQSHQACSFGYKVVCHYDKKYSKPVQLYRGEDAIEKFIRQMFIEVEDCQRVVREKFQKPLKMTSEEEKDFQSSTKCHICERRFYEENPSKVKVRDHCHITGKYRGAAHSDCNLLWSISAEKLKIPVVFHNLKGYDSHLIMQKIGKLIREGDDFNVDVIAQNFDKYIGFKIGNHLTLIDSFSFMSQSLDRLSSNLSEDKLVFTRDAFPEEIRLVRKKGIYPYDYMDSFSRFNETSLPCIEDFYSILNDTNITEAEYDHAKNVYHAFNIKNLGEYHDLYLKTDVLLLADVFENFRSTCLEYYRLDPCHYYSAPGLSWDAYA